MEMIPPASGSLKALLLPPSLNNVQKKGTQGVQARYGAELPPFISIVQYPARPVILGVEIGIKSFSKILSDHLKLGKGDSKYFGQIFGGR